jgi:hypothetical protein
VGLNPGVLTMVQRSPLGETLGRERMFFNLDRAVAAWQKQQPPRGHAQGRPGFVKSPPHLGLRC